MKKIALSLLTAAALVGCTTAEHIQTPEGHDLLDITCSGLDHPAKKCQRVANEECPNGYTMLSNTNASFGGWRNWFALGFNVQNAMVFQCHKPAPVVKKDDDSVLIKKTVITTRRDRNGNIISTTTNLETGAHK